ncbi:Rpn family recombination-promoting nuclease/putative transposase [Chamaesiphon sp. VAR_69_metabat_338]|uniref:Rpn family recombination-promoting nuclease/putative transposase n=1 Tax=Chamaesiphon sp. VAR_69_metabat_338 TaxID=2964704 RepID=UPI00286EA0EC|nr:Rpn family recombination-promoting nuclease/putative transposase [Chamaesiphon sp. VAR_69_metabat_338]
MRRDTIFYQLFQQSPALLFELIANPPSNAADYTFDSIEVKETSFRIDGVFLPPDRSGIIYFCEVQFQKDDLLYERFNSETSVYLYRNRERFHDWRSIVIYPNRGVEQQRLEVVSDLLASGRITRIYLDELLEIQQPPLGLDLILLTILDNDRIVAKAKTLIRQSQQLPNSRAIIDLISTIVVYKFTSLTRTEVEAMIGITLQETRVYQDAKAEGKAEGVNEGRQVEGQSLILRQLSRRFGTLPVEANTKVLALNLEQLENLGEALLDFDRVSDLMSWLETNR